jgi:hypothetical protein
MEERFIKNKRPLNLTHISFKKEKELELRTLKRTILMSQSNDDEETETLLKRRKRHEESTMKGSVNPQHEVKLLKK